MRNPIFGIEGVADPTGQNLEVYVAVHRPVLEIFPSEEFRILQIPRNIQRLRKASPRTIIAIPLIVDSNLLRYVVENEFGYMRQLLLSYAIV